MERSEPFVSPSQVLILRMRVMDGYGRRTVLDRTFVKKRSQSLIGFFFLNPRVLIPPTKFFEKLYNITKKALILRLKLLRKGRDWFSPACPLHYPEPSSNRTRGFSSLQLNFSKSSII